ncbi:hypothetical protein CDAR_13731 [Caerostris darwini]|uniref:Secreted protein n=1 Tax=Caerostris darwini TaxID=1538125 RepID=A0AAV4U7U0_9ARAC|nr:hypothetical protein CDAR_13731 [Caerostris darwini]
MRLFWQKTCCFPLIYWSCSRTAVGVRCPPVAIATECDPSFVANANERVFLSPAAKTSIGNLCVCGKVDTSIDSLSCFAFPFGEVAGVGKESGCRIIEVRTLSFFRISVPFCTERM